MHRFMWIFILPVIVSPNRPTLQDLRNFLNTHQKVWLFLTSKPRLTGKYQHRCIFFQVVDNESNWYKICEAYEYSVFWEHYYLYANISMVQNGTERNPVMDVSKEKGGPGIRYTLRKWDPRDLCAVRTYEESGKVECELYVWDETVGRNVTKCKKVYKNYCKGRKHRVFSRKACT